MTTPYDGKPIHVLYVDTNPEAADDLAQELARQGILALLRPAFDNDEARRALEEEGFDLVLVDQSEIEYFHEGRLADEFPKARNLPCILLTGPVEDDEAAQLMRYGATDVIDRSSPARLAAAILRDTQAVRNLRTAAFAEAERLIRTRRESALEGLETEPQMTPDEKLERILLFGCLELGMSNALVTELRGDEVFVLAAGRPTEHLARGFHCPADQTICREILVSDKAVGIEDIERSRFSQHKVRAKFGLNSYLACRVTNNRTSHISVCFLDEATRTTPFTTEDFEFVQRLAYRVNVELRNAQVEIELAQRNALFEAFMNHSPVMAALKDQDGRYTYINRSPMPEIEPWWETFRGKRAEEIFNAEDARRLVEADTSVRSNGEPVQLRLTFEAPGLGLRSWHVMKFPVELAGHEMYVGTVALDITDLLHTKRELSMAYEATLDGWVRTLDARDRETEGHSRRVAELSVRLAERLGFPTDQVPHLRRGALLHDIGKIAIPDAILHKPGPLSPEEWSIMRTHPRVAFNLLSPIKFLQPALDIPLSHHEKWNGTGYPLGLAEREIPWSARIFAVVDVYDALTSKRPYRDAWSTADALKYIEERSSTEFDPDVVEQFLEMVREGIMGSLSDRSNVL